MESINKQTISDAFIASYRRKSEAEMKYDQKITKAIGAEAYDELMRKKIPMTIVREILDRQRDNIKPDIYPLYLEIKAGTILWQVEFDNFVSYNSYGGGMDDLYFRTAILDFEQLISDYIEFIGEKRGSFNAYNLECSIACLVKSGFSRQVPKHATFALAATIANISSNEIAKGLTAACSADSSDKTIGQSINQVANWLTSGRWQPYVGDICKMSKKGAVDLLSYLYRQYNDQMTISA